MALKPHRLLNPYADDLTFYMNAVAEEGGMTTLSTGGSGAALDQADAVVAYAASQSGTTPMGVLLQPVVNKDLTQYHLNPYNMEVQIGSKVRINGDCTVETNMILGTPTAGGNAYLGPSGYFQVTQVNAANNPKVGVFTSKLDEDGYAKIRVKLT